MNGLRAFLLFNELSQQELADFLGISKGQMSKLVSGTAKLQSEQLSKILSNDCGWNTEFLTNPMWEDMAAWKHVAESGSIAIQQNGKKNKIGTISGESGEVLSLRKENEMLRAQVDELRAQNEKYWNMIEKLTEK